MNQLEGALVTACIYTVVSLVAEGCRSLVYFFHGCWSPTRDITQAQAIFMPKFEIIMNKRAKLLNFY